MATDDFENIRATITYKSGRVETFEAKLRKNNMPPVTFSKRVAASKSFPTVSNVKIEKF